MKVYFYIIPDVVFLKFRKQEKKGGEKTETVEFVYEKIEAAAYECYNHLRKTQVWKVCERWKRRKEYENSFTHPSILISLSYHFDFRPHPHLPPPQPSPYNSYASLLFHSNPLCLETSRSIPSSRYCFSVAVCVWLWLPSCVSFSTSRSIQRNQHKPHNPLRQHSNSTKQPNKHPSSLVLHHQIS